MIHRVPARRGNLSRPLRRGVRWALFSGLLVVTPGVALSALAHAADDRFQSFNAIAEKVVGAFTTGTDRVRNVKIDFRRRDTAPDSDVTIVGVLGIDIKPKDGPAWYSIRLLFGQRDGRWSFLTAYHELPSEGPTWVEASGAYRAIVEQAIGPSGR